MSRRISFTVLALTAALTSCERPAPTSPPDEPVSSGGTATSDVQRARERSLMDRLSRRVARAAADQEFRAYLKTELDRSPFREHKLQLQTFLRASNSKALREVARLNGESESSVESDAKAAIPLEIYFPVPAHRAAWAGGADLLVASAREDREAPVAYDTRGQRRVLSADHPPSTPVLAVVPVETDFNLAPTGSPLICCSDGPAPTPIPAGLHMTYARFSQDFEGWLKGSPEFEVHILGQLGASDSLTDYQCAGQHAGSPYAYDQNELTWSGRVLLFSQTQLNNYKAAHPSQNFRVVALEDDDTACAIKFDANRFKSLIGTLQAQYPNLTGAKDTTSGTLTKYVKRANALQKILRAAYSFITTQDDLIGNAIEDVVVGQFVAGANWFVKGDNNVTNGWLKLEMR
jgi:hypothetical protein